MTNDRHPSKRLLIGAGSFADALGGLRLAERLTESLAGDLGGLLVEETVVTEVVDLPGQRVVTSSGMLIMAPTRHQVRTLMEGDARAFRASLSGLARAKTRNWTFERRHGELISGLCDAAKGWDLLLLGYRQIHRQAGRVLLIAPPKSASQGASGLAQNLAQALNTTLVAFAIGPESPSPEDRRQDCEWFSSEAEILSRISRMNASVVVLDLSVGPLRTHDQLRLLLGVARCPVLVLGAALAKPSITHTTQIPTAPRDVN